MRALRNPRGSLPALMAVAALLFSPTLPSLALAQEAPPPPRTGPTDPAVLEAFIDGLMKVQLDEHNTAGAVVTVVKDGEVFFAKGYGYADWEARKEVDPETTLFRIGSISKLFTWTTVMQMVEVGALNLDTDINEYLEGFQIPDTYEEPITLRHVLTHSAGFEDWVVELFGDDAEEDVRPLGEILADQIPARVRPPGEVSSYSNHATGMASYIVSLAAGMPWQDFNQERILGPLGMEYTSFAQPLPEHLTEHMSKGYSGSGDFEEEDFEIVPMAGVGAGASSGTDMAKFMIAHLQLGAYGDTRILGEETTRLMHSELFRMAPGVNAMAHGFYQMNSNGEWIIGHGGDTFWFHSNLALFPEHDLGVFVSFNSQRGGAATGQFMDAFIDQYFPVAETLPTPPEDFADRADRFTGRFRANRFSHTSIGKLGALGGVKVNATEDGTLRVLDREWIEVAPLTFAEKYGDETLIFREAEDGAITHFFLGGAPVVAFERMPLRDGPVLHALILIFAGVMIVGTLVAWPLGWILRKWYRVETGDMERIPTRPRLALWMAALSYVFFALGMAIALSDPSAVAVEISTGLRVTLLFPLVGLLFTLISLWYAIQIRQQGAGRCLGRWAYTLAVLSFCLFTWQLHVWNLLGWRF